MPEGLRRLAAAHGVATSYRDERHRPVPVDSDVVIRVLALLDVDASSAAARRGELARLGHRGAVEGVCPTVAFWVGEGARVVPGARLLTGEDGRERSVHDELPADVSPGWYGLELTSGRRITVVAAPARVPPSASTWGWMLQLYALRSAGSWGIGDLRDLREFISWTATEHGAGAVLLNPLHAPGPTHPVEPSPYTPSSRRFANPLALRIEDIGAYQRADTATRAEVDALRVSPATARVDHDMVWVAKRAALELLWRDTARPASPGLPEGLREWATYCALAERHGGRWTQWPAGLRDVAGPAVADARAELAARIAFHAWVQQQCAAQLAAVRATAHDSGMALGVLHDLAVGVDPEGADAWALSDVLATGVSVGAPPDTFSPRGQNWGLPPWRPDRLAATGHAAWRDMLRAVLTHADGLRIDHVAGLWRLWWIPPGDPPERGTYVHYDSEALLAVLTLEAHRAGATVIGEDLGTVEAEVTHTLARRGILGCAVGWFTRDEDAPDQPLLVPSRWPVRAAASLSTHDLPTAAGFLRAEHVRARAELGLLPDVAAEQRSAADDRAEWIALLRAEQFLPDRDEAPDEWQIIAAMHRLLAATPCQLTLISPYDVLAEPRQPNLPGTIDQYPNWRLPLPVTFEELRTDARVAEITAIFRARTEQDTQQ
ncbi:MAG: 4-alpha-glucanotransferase [Actinomycetota bacterium]|nr:4-alpha-glucanotransferase [Actinomycetota bacterium]